MNDTLNSRGFSSRDRKIMYVLMSFQVIAWGFDYVVAKHALEQLEPLILLFLKYFIGLLVVLCMKMKTDRKALVRKKDIPMFIACSLAGEILYYYCQYSAMDYLPVSLVSIVLAFVPIVSIVIERLIFKRAVNRTMIIGVIVCVMGVILIIGVDVRDMLQSRWTGYVLSFCAVLSWNIYNFITESLHNRYSSVTLTCTQLVCTSLLLLPYVIHNFPAAECFTGEVIGGVIYLGVINVGIGFLISVRGVHVVGPTISAMFSNFLPITSTFFGWLFLQETLSPIQIAGGIIVITAACVVINSKGKLNEKADLKNEKN